MNERPQPTRILFVFAWLVVGGEETEVRLLARTLDPTKYRLDVVACFRKPGMPEQTHGQLAALGVDVDVAPYALSFEETVEYLAHKILAYDIIVSCQNVADIYPALEKLHWRPPLIEHGGLVTEAEAGPKHFTSRYIGVCRSIREAAASRMAGREHHAIEIPSMVDLSEFAGINRRESRQRLGIGEGEVLIGWVGRLDAKKRVEDFIEAAAILKACPELRFVVVGGPDAFMPEYANNMRELANARGLSKALSFLGDRHDIPQLMSAMDVFVWLSRGEGMPHVLAEAGAAGLPVVATADNGSKQQVEDGITGLFVPHQAPIEVAAAIHRLVCQPEMRQRLGTALRKKTASSWSATVVVPQWEAVFDAVLEERQPAPNPSIFSSFLQGGFECSTHRRRDGRRLDLIAATAHDVHAGSDYFQLQELGLLTVRDGLRWHLIERQSGSYDWSSFVPMLRAARSSGTQVIWDLMHYGWPDDVDIWSPEFVSRFSRFAAHVARLLKNESDETPFFCPINEISFHAWAGGDVSYLNPFGKGRGLELKVQLARASIVAMREILQVDPRAQFVHCEPAISVVADPQRGDERNVAEASRQAQFQAFDMISGATWPQLGGEPRLLDIVGLNYYPANQWVHGGPTIDERHPSYRPFRTLLAEAFARYGRPVAVTETGREGESRAAWFEMISNEINAARSAGVPVEGVCLYPIINHFGWDDDRDCQSGLFSNRLERDKRPLHRPLKNAIALRRAAGWTSTNRALVDRAPCQTTSAIVLRAARDRPTGPPGRNGSV